MSFVEHGYQDDQTRLAIIIFVNANPGATTSEIINGLVFHSKTKIRHWLWELFRSGVLTGSDTPHGSITQTLEDITWSVGGEPETFFWLQQDGSKWTQQDGSFWTQN